MHCVQYVFHHFLNTYTHHIEKVEGKQIKNPQLIIATLSNVQCAMQHRCNFQHKHVQLISFLLYKLRHGMVW